MSDNTISDLQVELDSVLRSLKPREASLREKRAIIALAREFRDLLPPYLLELLTEVEARWETTALSSSSERRAQLASKARGHIHGTDWTKTLEGNFTIMLLSASGDLHDTVDATGMGEIAFALHDFGLPKARIKRALQQAFPELSD